MIAIVAAIAVFTAFTALSGNSYRAMAATIPTGMPGVGTYAVTVDDAAEPYQTTAPTLQVTDSDGLYQEFWNLPPDSISLALSVDPTYPDAVDLNSLYLDGVTFSELPCTDPSKACGGDFYRPPNLEGITTPDDWSITLYSEFNDPSSPQSGVLQLSFIAYPPTVDTLSDGSTIEIQEIDTTMSFSPGYSISGSISQTHYQVIGDPTSSYDAFSGDVTSPAGYENIGESVSLV